MKIAVPHCGLAPESNSGGETYEREILKALARLGVEFEIILAKGKPYPKGFPQFHIHEVFLRKWLRWYISNLLWPHYLHKVEKNSGFDLLRIHSLRYTGPGVLWFNRGAKKRYPVVCHHHHIDPSPLNPFIEKRVIEGSDILITGSEFSKRQLIETFGTPEEKIRVVPYGVDEKFSPQPKNETLKNRLGIRNEKILLFLAGLKKRKKTFFLVDVFEEIKKNYHEPIKLIIAGSGPMRQALERYVASKDLAREVIFSGYVPEDEKIHYYNLADVFVFPSEMEGFGFSPAEAMACGKPVVLSRAGSLPEIAKHDKSGFCVPNDVLEFSKSTIFLLQNEKVRADFGAAGIKRAKAVFQWSIAAEKTLRLYEVLVDSAKSNSNSN